MTDKILVFIPCYNCAPQITRVLAQFDIKTTGYFKEILVLDNQSKDSTISAAIEAAKKIAGIGITIGKNAANYNLGGSHKAAFKYALSHNFTHLVVLHGDDQGHIADMLPVLQRNEHHLHDACLGARFMPDSSLIGYSRFRIFGNRVFNFIFSLGTGNPVKDLGSGLNIFSRRIMEDQKIMHYADDLRFNVYLLLGIFQQGMKAKYFPISWREDDQVSNVKMTSQALKTLQLLWLSLLGGENFRAKDHRTIIHTEYLFDVIYKQ